MNNEVIQLFIKYLNNQCTRSELVRVFEIIEEGRYKREWEYVLTEDALGLINSNYQSELSIEDVFGLHEKIQETIASKGNNAKPVRVKLTQWWRFAAAAVILITLSIGALYYSSRKPAYDNLANDVAPGGNKAVLTLANGEKIILNDAKKGELAAQSGVMVTKLVDGEIVYAAKPGEAVTTSANSIATPRGGQYQVVLPDGTKVLLNAASVLTFPVSFAAAKERRVELKGEAYFEVAKMKIPFIVSTNKEEIKVLGTHFNVSNYADESVSKTTLIEGSVLINALGTSKILTPGQQALVGNGGLTVAEANIEEVMAWKNGYFMFESEDIESVMRKVSRWYDVEVVFEGNVPKDKFGGTVSRFSNISKVLKILQLTNKVHFKIEERRVIVTK